MTAEVSRWVIKGPILFTRLGTYLFLLLHIVRLHLLLLHPCNLGTSLFGLAFSKVLLGNTLSLEDVLFPFALQLLLDTELCMALFHLALPGNLGPSLAKVWLFWGAVTLEDMLFPFAFQPLLTKELCLPLHSISALNIALSPSNHLHPTFSDHLSPAFSDHLSPAFSELPLERPLEGFDS